MSVLDYNQFECVIGVLNRKHREIIVLWHTPDALLDYLPEAWLEDNGDFSGFPAEPGVYKCLVTFDVRSVYGATEDSEWAYTCSKFEKVLEYPKGAP